MEISYEFQNHMWFNNIEILCGCDFREHIVQN